MSDYKAEVLKVAGIYVVRQTWGECEYLRFIAHNGKIYRTHRLEEAKRFRTKFFSVHHARYMERKALMTHKKNCEDIAIQTEPLVRVWR